MKALALSFATLLTAWPGYSAVLPPAINLTGYHACRQLMLEPGKNVLGYYVSNQSNCQRGPVVLAYERCVSKPTEKARYQIADTVRLQHRDPHDDLSITTCTTTTGSSQQYVVLLTPDGSGQKYLRHVKRVWSVSAPGQLVEVSPRALKCLNEDTAN